MFPRQGKLFDIGFGQGHFLEAARARGLEVVGVDRDPRLADQARSRGFMVSEGDVRSLRTLQLSTDFTGAIASHLVEHLQVPEVRQLLRDLAELVGVRGLLVIVTPKFADWRVGSDLFWWDPTHVCPYPEAAIRQLADQRDWTWDASGHEPYVAGFTRVRVLPGKLTFGWESGTLGRWYRFQRTGGPGPSTPNHAGES